MAVRAAAKPADPSHRYGHEKVENISGVVEGLLIIAAAVVIVYEAALKIVHGPHIEHIELGIAVMLVSAVDQPGGLARVSRRRSRAAPTRPPSRPTPPIS